MKNESKKQLLLLFFSVASLISSQLINNFFDVRELAIDYKIINKTDSIIDFNRDDIFVDSTKDYCIVLFSNLSDNSINSENIPITLNPTTIEVDTVYFENTSRTFVDSSSIGYNNNVVKFHIGQLNKISPIKILIVADRNIDSVIPQPNINNCSIFENGDIVYQPFSKKVIVWLLRIVAVVLFIWVGYFFLKKKLNSKNDKKKESDNIEVINELNNIETKAEEPKLQKGLRRYLSGWRDGNRSI